MRNILKLKKCMRSVNINEKKATIWIILCNESFMENLGMIGLLCLVNI